jgi:hypothetical protein
MTDGKAKVMVTALRDEATGYVAWYLDDQYVGHDDQITAFDVLAWLGGEVRPFTWTEDGGFPEFLPCEPMDDDPHRDCDSFAQDGRHIRWPCGLAVPLGDGRRRSRVFSEEARLLHDEELPRVYPTA